MDTKTLPQCQPWCPPEGCEVDRSDGSVFHMSPQTLVDVVTGGANSDGPFDLSLSRLDREDATGATTVDLAIACDRTVGMTPGQALVFAEQVRAHALTAAGPDGVDMPVELVRLGEQVRVDGRWETVETLFADGWCCGRPVNPDHRPLVQVCTGVHDDDDGHQFAAGDLVRVRLYINCDLPAHHEEDAR